MLFVAWQIYAPSSEASALKMIKDGEVMEDPPYLVPIICMVTDWLLTSFVQ